MLAGCATRSISDSGYHDGGYRAAANPLYKGELFEFAVLGIDPNESISEQDIAAPAPRASALHLSVARA